MPLSAGCPSCSARITAPDRLAGKTVKCPKCQATFSLPAPDPGFEVVEDDEPVVARPKVKPPAADEGFTLVEDDEPERPKPKKKLKKRVVEEDEDELYPVPRRRTSGGSAAGHTRLFVALGGGLAFLAVATAGVYFALTKVGTAPTTPNTSPAPAPAPDALVEWKTFAPAGAGFSVSVPGTPAAPKDIGEGSAAGLLGANVQSWESTAADHKYTILVVTIMQELPGGAGNELIFDAIVNGVTSRADKETGVKQSDVPIGKHPGRQMAFTAGEEQTILRTAVVGSRLYLFAVSSKTRPLVPAEEPVRKYLDSITLK